MHQLFNKTPPTAPPVAPTVTHQAVTKAFFWFSGYTTLKGIPDNIYNTGQKLTSRLIKEAPMSQLVDFVRSTTTQ